MIIWCKFGTRSPTFLLARLRLLVRVFPSVPRRGTFTAVGTTLAAAGVWCAASSPSTAGTSWRSTTTVATSPSGRRRGRRAPTAVSPTTSSATATTTPTATASASATAAAAAATASRRGLELSVAGAAATTMTAETRALAEPASFELEVVGGLSVTAPRPPALGRAWP